ncbi:MAG TPA: DUF1013 domain-containing protein, partial [Sneathiellales bacterium]|nr:DUF1013 domain-containing protein [Sneathiellales bacterium]
MSQPLMPKATAVWLVDNTVLTFDQIADFCGLHPLEVKGIADGDVAQGIVGTDPVANGQLTQDEIESLQNQIESTQNLVKAGGLHSIVEILGNCSLSGSGASITNPMIDFDGRRSGPSVRDSNHTPARV